MDHHQQTEAFVLDGVAGPSYAWQAHEVNMLGASRTGKQMKRPNGWKISGLLLNNWKISTISDMFVF